MKQTKFYFPKRIPEPKAMEKTEQRAFAKLSKINFEPWTKPFVAKFKDFSLSSKNTKNILDVACGPGYLTKALAKSFPKSRIFGLDTSTEAVILAKKNCKLEKNAKIVRGSAYKLPFGKNAFDLLSCKDSLHHFDNPKKALLEMLRVLKSKGKIFIVDIKRNIPLKLLKLAIPPDTEIKKLQFYSARASYTKTEISKILKKIKNIRFKIYEPRRTKKFAGWLKKNNLNPSAMKNALASRFWLEIYKK